MKVKLRLVAVLVEQRPQGANILGRRRHVGALVAAELLVDQLVVVADRAGMELHGQAVFDAHAGHLGQHLRLEDLLLLAAPSWPERMRS